MNKLFLGITLFFTIGMGDVWSQCRATYADHANYTLVWEEEFDTYGSAGANHTDFINKWNKVDVDKGWGGTEYYRPSQVSVLPITSHPEGILRLHAKKTGWRMENGVWVDIPGDPDLDPDTPWKHYMSGAVTYKLDALANPDTLPASAYGMIEFRAHISSGNDGARDIWPALWYYAGGGTEIDVIDDAGKDGQHIAMNAINWKYVPKEYDTYAWTYLGYTATTTAPPLPETEWQWNTGYSANDITYTLFYDDNDNIKGYRRYKRKNISGISGEIKAQAYGGVFTQKEWNKHDFSDDYHVYTVAWTPSKITFFINGRETYSIDNTELDAGPAYNTLGSIIDKGTIILSLQGKYPSDDDTNPMTLDAYMDVDYIRIYRPINGVYATSEFKSSTEFMYHNITDEVNNSSIMNVHSDPNSIATNPNNPNEVFYRGTDNKLYHAILSGGNWSISLLSNFSYPSGTEVEGDLIYSSNKIFYKGAQRVQSFYKSGGNWLHAYIDDNWGQEGKPYWEDFVSMVPNSMVINTAGDIIYRGWDNKLRRLHWMSSGNTSNNWDGELIAKNTYTYTSASYIDGDVVIGGSGKVFYRGVDGKVQVFWSTNLTKHAWLDFNSPNLTHSYSGSMAASSSDEIFYVGIDNSIYRYYWSAGWQNEQVMSPSTWEGTTFNYSKIDFPSFTLEVDPSDNSLLYTGLDGRIQRVKSELVLGTWTWTHKWVDDYWNTDYHTSYAYPHYTKSSSINVTPNGKIFYSQHNGGLSSFEYGPCENLVPYINTDDGHLTGVLRREYVPTNSTTALKSEHSEITELISTTTKTPTVSTNTALQLFPNPAKDVVNIILSENKIEQIQLFDQSGRIVRKFSSVNQKQINIKLNDLPAGLYMVVVNTTEGKTISEKLIIN